jgi:hypothetical protein
VAAVAAMVDVEEVEECMGKAGSEFSGKVAGGLFVLERPFVLGAALETVCAFCPGFGFAPEFAICDTMSLNKLAVNGEDCKKAGRCAHAQSGRVVVDSQSIMHVYTQRD